MKIKHLSLLVIVILCLVQALFIGCATTKPQLATVTYNPVKEWDASKRLCAMPYSEDTTRNSIELKLSRIVTLLGGYGGLNFVDDLESADMIVSVLVDIDTVEYMVEYAIESTVGLGHAGPRFSYKGNNSTTRTYSFLDRFNTSSESVTIKPSQELRNIFGHVSLRVTENDAEGILDDEKTIIVAHAFDALFQSDPLVTFYNLARECLYEIPEVHTKELDRTPILRIYTYTNWLSGVKVTPDYNYTDPLRPPLLLNDVIFKINDERIYDFLDYMNVLLSLEENEKSCRVSFNREGKIEHKTVQVKR